MIYRRHITIIYILLYVIACPAVLSLYAQENQSSDSIFCSNCSTENPAANKFCYHCGTPLPKRGQNERNREAEWNPTRQELLKKPKGREDKTPDPAIEITVEEIYDYGISLFNSKKYNEAMDQFYKIIIDFPDSRYYEKARAMTDACGRILMFKEEA